jgi:sodium/potassium/calcium exchanger 6
MEKIPISLYGFFIAATWIDKIAEALVGLLQFAGTISRIPSTILGLTVLSWGNSMGDLSANLAMARKGMPDMATTGCFAGPSFNLLVGTGLGFLNLQYKLGRSTISPVSITPSIRVGFSFIIVNCLSIVVAGSLFGWRLPRRYSLFLFALYIFFIALSIERAVDNI